MSSTEDNPGGPPDRLTQRVLQVCDAVGDFIAWWGFKAIHGRVWTLLALRGRPMSQAEVARTLGVSRALMSSAMSELSDYGLVRPVGPRRNAPWQATLDVWPVIADVLRSREWMLIESARVALEAAIEEAEITRDLGEPLDWDLTRMRVLLGLTETAQAFLRILVRLRVPRTLDALGSWLRSASGMLRSLRRYR
ncbi:MAG: hypothetical protein ACQEXJ_24290 [Myxococcota bacterium]